MKQALVLISHIGFTILGYSQTSFNLNEYSVFLENNKNLVFEELSQMYPLKNQYYKGIENGPSIWDYQYLDSIHMKFTLTADELSLLEENHFMVTERHFSGNFGDAFYQIYNNDLPVFISTDAILHALHKSYDDILKEVERSIMLDNLAALTQSLYDGFPALYKSYKDNSDMINSLKDVDLYVTIAHSLLNESLYDTRIESQSKAQEIWNAIASESASELQLFCETPRFVDFSQFKVRGHYVDDHMGVSLEPYFKAMMWLGRIDFWMSKPETGNFTEEDILRMSMDALLLNELIDDAGTRNLMEENGDIINFLIGESDNLTPTELSGLTERMQINSAEELLDSITFVSLSDSLINNNAYGQRILGSMLETNPFTSTPEPLPVSFKLMGQRFILDSYILSSVVYDKIIFENEKIKRMMPDPLDVLFCLGNENALPLLQNELNTYKYSSQLNAVKYLVDSYEGEFWQSTLYNNWLNALIQLNAPDENESLPFFMKTAAWQHEKMNTQLASWSQLRHDNLLYAKPSYTGMIGCSFPHSYVEPYPAFYLALGNYAESAASYFGELQVDPIRNYFTRFAELMSQLEVLAIKELNGTSFSEDENNFLKEMLSGNAIGCGPMVYTGWYADLYYDFNSISDFKFAVCDIHTQPTDEYGNIVGKVLHAATAEVNFGVFLVQSPSDNFAQTAYIGPVMSYYEEIRDNFFRLNDLEWTEAAYNEQAQGRPDWVHIYLADKSGNRYAQGPELNSTIYQGEWNNINQAHEIETFSIYPNPVTNQAQILFGLYQEKKVSIRLYDQTGRMLKILANQEYDTGSHLLDINTSTLSKGFYICTIQCGNEVQTIKLVK